MTARVGSAAAGSRRPRPAEEPGRRATRGQLTPVLELAQQGPLPLVAPRRTSRSGRRKHPATEEAAAGRDRVSNESGDEIDSPA
jgi:hypothetical protein